ncbi:hypothetical protein GJU39_11600 [Pedobacter petrophilus]|uniref:DUF7033 domain-containing protein n=1 Tax=Pedobacter petrophilus TaxID=1908241 RepID=A0A7K0FYS4_9SPHI|nr:hypothetical protein [Pedobacter petrophilus]MRX76733.1 hypothetical protein [Pedobacter petrophilus]
MHLIVFSAILTPRIKYIFNFIFRDILKAEVEFTGNSQFFLESKQAKISYGDVPLGNELFFKSSALLFSNKLEETKIKITSFGEYQVPFPVQNSLLPFDVFAASFFIVSRYEEYLHQQKTQEDFKASKSYQYKWKILDRPIIDEWALILRNIILTKYPQFKFYEKNFAQQPTVNFDVPAQIPTGFTNKAKFFFNTIVSKENNFISAGFDRLTGLDINIEQVLQGVATYFNLKKISPVYFVGFPEIPDDYIGITGISKILTAAPVGLLRPCASDKQKISHVKAGLSKLKKILPEQVNLNSQQLEVLKFPLCYLNLLNSAITSDYSMGYAETPGFRAGTCTAFSWYDLQLEKVTPLSVKSYCFTDSALEPLNIQDINELIAHFIDSVKVVKGTLVSSWKLRTLSTHLKYKKLNTAFKQMLEYGGSQISN